LRSIIGSMTVEEIVTERLDRLERLGPARALRGAERLCALA
jgi:hypothetical protein